MIDDRPIKILPKCTFSRAFWGQTTNAISNDETTTTTTYTQMNERPMKKKVFNIRVTGIYRWLGYHAVSIVMTDPGRKVRLSTDDEKECCNSVFNPRFPLGACSSSACFAIDRRWGCPLSLATSSVFKRLPRLLAVTQTFLKASSDISSALLPRL